MNFTPPPSSPTQRWSPFRPEICSAGRDAVAQSARRSVVQQRLEPIEEMAVPRNHRGTHLVGDGPFMVESAGPTSSPRSSTSPNTPKLADKLPHGLCSPSDI